jgi:uncharacterized membrane protein
MAVTGALTTAGTADSGGIGAMNAGVWEATGVRGRAVVSRGETGANDGLANLGSEEGTEPIGSAAFGMVPDAGRPTAGDPPGPGDKG